MRIDSKAFQNRNSTLDIIRIVSVFLVISVHFFLYNGFYSQPVVGAEMFVMCIMRTFFGACVPMFMLLSGYLMCKKEISKKYYFGLSKTLITYVLAGAACIAYKAFFQKNPYTLEKVLSEFFNFSAANYAWYIEMYIGLFLLIPFLNLAYNKLETKQHKQILVMTMIALTILPTMLNVFDITNAAWWANPIGENANLGIVYDKLIPSFWLSIYPITYYFTGCYLREYGLKFKKRTLVLLLVLTTVVFAGFNYWRSCGSNYVTGNYGYWYGIQPFVTSVLLFELLNRIKTEKFPVTAKFLLCKLSNLVLSIYLVSYISDSIIYPVFNNLVPIMTKRVYWYLPVVLIEFALSIMIAVVLYYIELALKFIFKKIVSFIKEIKKNNSVNLYDLSFVILLAGAIAFAVTKAYYGFGGDDEAFYLSIPHRLSLGDTLFADEWHLSQLSGFITLPFVWLYQALFGTTEGIILTFRYLYIILHALVSIFLYIRIKKYGLLAIVSALSYYIFAPYNIMALSYNTMAMDFLLLAGLLVSTSTKRVHFVLGGLSLAASVLCCPYLAAVYAIYAIAVGINELIKRTKLNRFARKENMFSTKTFLWVSVGVFALAAVFFIYIACTCGIRAIFENLPLMLADPEHPTLPILDKVKLYFSSIYTCHDKFVYAICSYAIMLLAMLIDRKRKNHRAFYLIISTMITLMCYVFFFPNLLTMYYNAIMFPLVFIGITSYILCKNKPSNLLFGVFISGIIYSFAVTMTSNQYFFMIATAIAVSNTVSFVFLAQVLKEMKESPDDVAYSVWLRRLTVIAVSIVISVLGFLQLKCKENHCFLETTEKSQLTYRINNGPAKGIYTNSAKKSVYEIIHADLQYFDNVEKGNILMLTGKTFTYLSVEDFPYGSFSAWVSGENDMALNRLTEFYRVNQDKIPKYIYLPKQSYFNAQRIISTAKQYGYVVLENDVSYKMYR